MPGALLRSQVSLGARDSPRISYPNHRIPLLSTRLRLETPSASSALVVRCSRCMQVHAI
jgi:hypothetical protein